LHLRYGFNGKEHDSEAKGWQNQVDYGNRIYDPRVGRFLSVDPLQKRYPYFTPYQFAGNQPIWAIDLDGLEPYYKTGIKHIPSYWDNNVWNGTIGDYKGLINGYAIEYEKKTYVIFESAHGTRQWYVEYDKDGWKGSPTEFQWYNPAEDRSVYWLVAPVVGIPALAVYGKAFFIWLGKEVLEEVADVPIFDNPIDLWKQKLKKEAKEEISEEMAEQMAKKEVQSLPNNSMRKPPSRAPEFEGGQVTESGFLRSALKWLGEGYRDLGKGRYVSKDGLRQVRYGKHETTGNNHHGHFEIYDRPVDKGGQVIENTSVKIVPDN
jgi:RHS repeat-associated protein